MIHHQDIHQKMQEAEKMLGIIHEEFDEVETVFREMAQIKINQDGVKNYLRKVFPDPQDGDELARFTAIPPRI